MDKPADKAKKQMQSMGLSAPYMGSKETRTEEEVVQDRKTLAENVPILGEAMLAKEIADDVKDENYLSAVLNTAALAVGAIPGVGDIANKPIRAAARAMRKDVKVKPTSVAGPYYDAPTYGDYHSRAAQVDQEKGLEKLKKLQGKNADFDLIQETVSESRIGNTRGQTAQADEVSFDPAELKNVKGLMGEELYRSGDYTPPGRGSKLKLLKKNIKEKGYKPEPITIVVREDGAPFIAEGNHRLAEALESRRPKIDANIQYLRNAEKVDGPLNPKRLKNLKSDIDLLVRNSYEIKNNKSTFNEGGVVPMNNMAKQMEMFEEGGLMDEGGTVDPVSGNDVPPGSTQEEVRDDIPAQLSEGEFVFPADVVRFIGLEKLMMIRQRAKAGLQRMEDMGQMGNSEEAVMPDDLPFSIDDLDMEDDGLEMAQGGVVRMANGGTYNVPDPSAGVYYNPASQPTTGVAAAPMKAASSNIARSIPIAQAATPLQAGSGKPTMFTDYELPQAPVPVMTAPDQLPKFLGEVAPGVGGIDYTEETYMNEAGNIIKFRRYNDGSLKDAQGNEAVIPEGYKLKSEAEETVTIDPTKVETATVQDDGGNDGPDKNTEATLAFGGTKAGGKRAGLVDNAFTANIAYTGFSPMEAYGVMGTGFSSLANSLTGGKVGEPVTLSGKQGVVISNIVDPRTKTGFGRAQTLDFSVALNANQYNSLVSRAGVDKVTSRTELADIVTQLSKINDSLAGETLDYGRAKYLAESVKMGRQDEIEDSIAQGKGLDKAIADALGRDRGKVEGSGIFGTNIGAKDRTGAVSAAERASMTASEKAAIDAAMTAYAESMSTEEPDDYDNGNDNNNNDSGGGTGESGGDPGPGEAGVICLTEDMKVKRNGVIDFVTKVQVGDIVDNTVVTEVLHKHMREGYYKVNGELKITNDHPVLANGSWKRTEDLVLGDYINNVEVTSLEYVEQVTPTVYIGTADDRYNVYTEGEVYTVHGQYKNGLKKAA